MEGDGCQSRAGVVMEDDGCQSRALDCVQTVLRATRVVVYIFILREAELQSDRSCNSWDAVTSSHPYDPFISCDIIISMTLLSVSSLPQPFLPHGCVTFTLFSISP